MALNGKYVAVSEDGFKDFLLKEGAPASRVELMASLDKNIYDVKVDGSKVTIVHQMGDQPIKTSNYIIGQEVEEKMTKSIHKSTAKLSGNDLHIDSITDKGDKRSRVFKFTADGLEVLHISEKGKGKIVYKRA